jgi:hypothetical protein
MNDNTRKPISGRRNFLLALGATSAATAAAVIGKGATAVVPGAGKEKSAAKGYQLSEHVRTYYRTAKI